MQIIWISIWLIITLILGIRWVYLEVYKSNIDVTMKLKVCSIEESNTVEGYIFYKVKCKPLGIKNEGLNLEIDFNKTITIMVFELNDINVGDEISFNKLINKEQKWDK